MSRNQKVSSAVVRRLPKYYRYLKFIGSKGIVRVSSQELSNITGLTASQIRQDLNHFGGFGQQGYGYNVEELTKEIEKIIGIDKEYKAIVVGTGNVGKAITLYAEFKKSGFNIVGLFDKSESLVGTKIDDLEIMDIFQLTEFQKNHKPEIAILAAPGEVAQDLCDTLVDNGIQGIWNFAPIDLKLPEEIVLEDVHLDESLYTLIYYINNINDYDIKK